MYNRNLAQSQVLRQAANALRHLTTDGLMLHAVEGAVSLGCFGDNPFPARAVPHQLGPARSETYTPQKCATFAREAGYRVGAVFALGSIFECYAGNSAVRARVYGGKARSAISAQCNMRCGDDAPKSLATCGGDYAISVYVLTDGGASSWLQSHAFRPCLE